MKWVRALGLATVVSVLLCAGGLAQAQQPEADPWAEYHRAFQALALGHTDEARRILQDLAARRPDHPAAAYALRMAQALAPTPAPPAPADGLERRTGGARAELVLFQTIHGMAVGAETCVALECSGARAHAVSLLAGAGGGLAASFFASRGGLTSGQTLVIDSGVLWGAWNAIALLGARGGIVDVEDRNVARSLLLGQTLGLGGGLVLARQLRPTEGEVSVATTVSVWATVLTLFAAAATEIDDEQQLWTALLVASDAALVGGAVLGRRHPMSRGRTLIIDAGGIVGMLGGFLVAVAAEANSAPGEWLPPAIGTAAGLAIATVATRDWDAPTPAATVGLSLTPTQGGALAGIGGTF